MNFDFKKISRTDKILYIIIFALLFALITGTIAGLAKNAKNPELKVTETSVKTLNKPASSENSDYFEIGRLRIVSGEAAIVISPWLEYPKGDTVFYEELARKSSFIKSVVTKYFSSKTTDQLRATSEEKITYDLLKEINAELSLGQITNIYYTDYIFID